MTSRLRLRSYLLPFATALALAAQVIDPSPVWKGLLAAFGGSWLLGYLWARALHKNLRLERAMRYGWAQVGDRLEEQFELHNEGWLPATWVEISDGSTLPGYSVAEATGVEGHSRNAWRTSGVCARRGVFTLGLTRLATGDPLGIYRVEIAYPEAVTLTVMPPIIPLPFLDTAVGGWQGEGRPRPYSNAETLSAETVRPYLPGDSLRLMHWPTYARLGEPYVRILESAPASDWAIVLDVDERVQAAVDEAQSTLELGIILAASVADRGLRMQRSVGLIAAGLPPIWMRPEQGEQQRWEILRTLARLAAGSTPLASLLESAGPSFGRHANLIVITPSTEGDWVDSLSKRALRLAGSVATTALLIDASTFGAAQGSRRSAELLTQAGIASHTVGRELLSRPEARPGPEGQWEWRVLPTGKAVPVRRPADTSWKGLQ